MFYNVYSLIVSELPQFWGIASIQYQCVDFDSSIETCSKFYSVL